MAITNFRITDPYTGEIQYTKNPKQYKGLWMTPAEHDRKMDENKEQCQKVQRKYKEFRRKINLFRSS